MITVCVFVLTGLLCCVLLVVLDRPTLKGQERNCLDMTEMYGPNTALVERVIEQARSLTAEQAEQLDATRDAAWDTVRGAVEYAARYAAWGAAWGAAWYAARGAAWDAAWRDARYAAWDAARGAVEYAAWGAACDAAVACVVADLITPEQFATLTAPWVSVMGPLEVTA